MARASRVRSVVISSVYDRAERDQLSLCPELLNCSLGAKERLLMCELCNLLKLWELISSEAFTVLLLHFALLCAALRDS